MATKRPSSGLFSKVAVFFRDSVSPDVQEGASVPGQDVEGAKHAIKELIERKRQDDHVRRREFNELRKLRKKFSHGTGPAGIDGMVRPSVFQSSSAFAGEDRASTLKKIDVIEQHMVRSWASALGSGAASGADQPSSAPPRTSATVATAVHPVEVPGVVDMNLDFTSMLMQGGATDWSSLETSPPTQPGPEAVAAAAPAPEQLLEMELVSEPSAMEQAALHWAQGDGAAAEGLLLGLLQGDRPDPVDVDLWASALFDLYRASGQEDAFDVVAMDYAQRFGRSPAEWFSVPEWLDRRKLPSLFAKPGLESVWECPPVLDAQALASLQTSYPDPDGPCPIDWSRLMDLAPDVVAPLAELVDYWCAHPVELHWSGTQALLQALQWHTAAGDRSADPRWWHLRLNILRILQRDEEFESLALDYCVLYEVSPPGWKPALCKWLQSGSTPGLDRTVPGAG
ncbi:MAG: hypothetical protein ACR2I0_03695, partial [Rhodoferax sp.]